MSSFFWINSYFNRSIIPLYYSLSFLLFSSEVFSFYSASYLILSNSSLSLIFSVVRLSTISVLLLYFSMMEVVDLSFISSSILFLSCNFNKAYFVFYKHLRSYSIFRLSSKLSVSLEFMFYLMIWAYFSYSISFI
jgi:hypothetical protein